MSVSGFITLAMREGRTHQHELRSASTTTPKALFCSMKVVRTLRLMRMVDVTLDLVQLKLVPHHRYGLTVMRGWLVVGMSCMRMPVL